MKERTAVEGSPGRFVTDFSVEEIVCEEQCIHSEKCPMLAKEADIDKRSLGSSSGHPEQGSEIVLEYAVISDAIERAKKKFPHYTIGKVEVITGQRVIPLRTTEEGPEERLDGMLLALIILLREIKSPVAEAMLAANKTKPRE